MSEIDMRRDQFVKALALASASFNAGDHGKAQYWLDGAALILVAAKNTRDANRATVVEVANVCGD